MSSHTRVREVHSAFSFTIVLCWLLMIIRKETMTQHWTYIDKSETYPENLGSGMPHNPDYRNQNILRVKIYNKTGDREKARKANDEIQEYTRKFGEMRRGSIFERRLTDTYIKPF